MQTATRMLMHVFLYDTTLSFVFEPKNPIIAEPKISPAVEKNELAFILPFFTRTADVANTAAMTRRKIPFVFFLANVVKRPSAVKANVHRREPAAMLCTLISSL